MTPGEAIEALKIEVRGCEQNIEQQVSARYARASNELANAAHNVLNNPSPSKAGNPPGVRSGDLRGSWTPYYSGGGASGVFGIQSGMYYSVYLEDGTKKMAARPYVDKVKEKALPGITAIFAEIGG